MQAPITIISVAIVVRPTCELICLVIHHRVGIGRRIEPVSYPIITEAGRVLTYEPATNIIDISDCLVVEHGTHKNLDPAQDGPLVFHIAHHLRLGGVMRFASFAGMWVPYTCSLSVFGVNRSFGSMGLPVTSQGQRYSRS